MRFGIHGVFILVRIIRIGNFARQFFRHGIVAAWIIRLNGRGAHDDFRAKRFQQIHFFLGLLVGDGENHFVAAHRGDERQSHAGISGCTLDNCSAWFEQAFALGIINHRDADAILHRAAGIQVVHFRVDFRRKSGGDAVQPHQRRASDGFQDVFTLHGATFLVSLVFFHGPDEFGSPVEFPRVSRKSGGAQRNPASLAWRRGHLHGGAAAHFPRSNRCTSSCDG